ncbi:MAG: molybdopterin-dependent oxidoreductase [Chloroflexi bacterium]|nr:molybdopterin-dependent oxidoreductase [Chloroflexota bacterium]
MRQRESRDWTSSIAVGAAATAAAMLLQQAVRVGWQVRSLPERIMEWLLLFVPLDLFERGLQQFGASAKEIALVGIFAGMAVLLMVVATALARTASSGWVILLTGFGLWLFTMLVIMPLTGAGPFATGLLSNPVLTNSAYLVVFAAFAAVTALFAAALDLAGSRRQGAAGAAINRDRRSVLAGLAAACAALVAYGAGRATSAGGAAVQSSLPLAAAPTSLPAPTATPLPPRAGSGVTLAPPTSAPITPTTVPTAAAEFATPAAARSLARGEEGSLTAAGRSPGTLAPVITSNTDFYVVTKNPVADPVLDANTWRLVIDGEVEHPVQVDYGTLVKLPPIEITKTLECISNLTAGCSLAAFGCDLVSTAVWRGARLGDVLGLAGGLKSSAVAVVFLGYDEFTAALAPDAVLDPDSLLVYQMNGQILPREHGYPARVLVPGRYGMKNTKWVAGIRAVDQPYADWYQQRGWTKDGFVKTMSRIDVPTDGARLDAGPQRVAGIAYAGDRGIQRVEVSADGGMTWQATSLLEQPPGKDVMVRWAATFTMADQPVMLVVRATDGAGQAQTDDFGLPAPDGGWGQDSIQVQPA